MFPNKMLIILSILACIVWSAVPLSTDRPTQGKIDMGIKKKLFGKTILYVNSRQALQFKVENLSGNKLRTDEWEKTKNTLSKDMDYVKIEINPLNGWQLSNARIKDSLDEQSYQKDGVILTICGIQKVSSGFKVTRSSGTVNMLFTQGSSEVKLSLRIAEFKESQMLCKKKYFLNYSEFHKAFNLSADNDETEDIEFPADLTL